MKITNVKEMVGAAGHGRRVGLEEYLATYSRQAIGPAVISLVSKPKA